MTIRGTKGSLGRRRLRFLVLAAALAWPVQAAEARCSPPATDAFDEAFRFASALTIDPGDMARAQEQVVRERAASGDLAGAARLAEAIEGWRRAAVAADLGSLHAARGEKERALDLARHAESLRQGLTGWPARRVAVHVAEVWARLGEIDKARQMAREATEADPRQYMARGAGIVAIAHATRGKMDLALDHLVPLDADADLEAAFWRTWGYTETARLAKGADRDRAFDAAERSASGVPGFRRIESLESLSGALSDSGLTARARSIASEAGKAASALPDSMPIKGRLLARVARRQAALGMASEARDLVTLALESAPVTLVVDRPAIHGEAAAFYAALGDVGMAREILHRALDSAASLENARPRALALVEILAAAGRAGIPIEPAIRERLERFHRGLGPPW